MIKWIDHPATSVAHLSNGYTLWVRQHRGQWTVRVLGHAMLEWFPTREAAKSAAEAEARSRVAALASALGMNTAAPRLLAALKAMVEAGNAPGDQWRAICESLAMAEARAAIAEAEGESP